MEKLDEIDNLLFCTYLQEYPKRYNHILNGVSKNCIIFCFDKKRVDYIRDFYPSIINVIYILFSM